MFTLLSRISLAKSQKHGSIPSLYKSITHTNASLTLLRSTLFLRLTLQILIELLEPRPSLGAHAKPPKRRSKNAPELLAM